MPPSSKDLPFTSAGAWGQHHLGALQQPLLTTSTHSAPLHETMCTHNVSSPGYRLRQAPRCGFGGDGGDRGWGSPQHSEPKGNLGAAGSFAGEDHTRAESAYVYFCL